MPVQWRTADLGRPSGLLDGALRGRRQPGAVLSGPPGVGKTVLARTAVERFSQRHARAPVQWLAGTASARHIPFGVFSHLVDIEGIGDSTTLLRAARASLLRRHGPDLVLGVDDAHHLDNLSATLVHQLALSRCVRLVVTVRSGEPAPDAITALWKDGILPRVEVSPFDLLQTRALLEAVLGGPLETASLNKIYAMSQGNPLYLRHLVDGALDRGSLREVEGVWQLRGDISFTPELSTLIGDHLKALPAEVFSVLEYLAVQDPLTLGDLSALVSRRAVEQAEDLNAIEVHERGNELVVHPAHPLYTEGVRASLGKLAKRRLRTELVVQLSSRPAADVTARLRRASLAISSDKPPPLEEVLESSYEAMRLGDLLLGERLARSALDRGAGLRARLPLAHALAWLGRGREADDVLAAVDPADLGEWDLTCWTLPRAANRFWMLNEPAPAIEFLQRMRARIGDCAATDPIDALAATFEMNAGDPRAAVDIASRVLASPSAVDLAVAWAAATATLSCARLGRFADVPDLARRGLSAEHPGLLRFTIGFGEITMSLMTESVADAQRRARHYKDFSELQQPGCAIGAVLLARTLMAAGELSPAVSMLRESAAALADTGYSWGPLALMYLAQALGQMGEAADAEKVLARAERAHGLRSELYAPELALARAWTRAATHDLDGAVAAARDAARIARATGQSAVTLHALHEAVRLGDDDAVDAVSSVLSDVECSTGRAVLAHAVAVARRSPAALDTAAHQLETIGMVTAAADAYAQAAALHAAGRDRKRESASKARATELGHGASTPALRRVLQPLPLTERERQIALMVAEGLSNKAVADRLGVSVRTVEGHIYRACTKLDTTDRAALADAVAPSRTGSRLLATQQSSPGTL